jgi:hypothetical protein
MTKSRALQILCSGAILLGTVLVYPASTSAPAIQRLDLTSASDGPSIVGLFGRFPESEPKSCLPNAKCPYGYSEVCPCALYMYSQGGNSCGMNCVEYDCMSTTAARCCIQCVDSLRGSQCLGCDDAFGCS